MTPGEWGELAVYAIVYAIVLVIAVRLARRHRVFRLFRVFRDAETRARDAETLNVLSRIEDGAVLTRPARAPYRTPKTPLSFSIVRDDGEDEG